MQPQNEKQQSVEAQGQAKKPRFKIEKLEERIAPHSAKIYGHHNHRYRRCHPNGCYPR